MNESDETYLPVTLQQFEDLTNEILVEFNKHTAPNGLDANYFSQVLMGVLHGLPKTQARVKKSDLLDGCIVMVSRHVTFHAVKAIEAAMRPAGAAPQAESDEVV